MSIFISSQSRIAASTEHHEPHRAKSKPQGPQDPQAMHRQDWVVPATVYTAGLLRTIWCCYEALPHKIDRPKIDGNVQLNWLDIAFAISDLVPKYYW